MQYQGAMSLQSSKIEKIGNSPVKLGGQKAWGYSAVYFSELWVESAMIIELSNDTYSTYMFSTEINQIIMNHDDSLFFIYFFRVLEHLSIIFEEISAMDALDDWKLGLERGEN